MGNSLKKKEWLILTILVILALLPIAYGFFYIDKYGVNIPIEDQWGQLVPWTIQYYEGTFNPAELISRQNDSRAFFPNLVMMGISIVTRMDIKEIFYAGYIIYICFIALVARLLFKDLDIQINYFFLFLLPVLYYAFNPYYLYRFIFNLGSVTAPMTVLFALLTIYALDRSKKQDTRTGTYLFFGLSILFGVMCSFSGSTGLPIWFAGLIQISLQDTKEKMKKGIFWIIGAATLFFTYYIALEFKTEGIHGTEGYSAYLVTAITYPVHKLLCFMGVLGAEVIHDEDIALFFGILLTGILMVLLYTNRNSLHLDKNLKWYTLMAYGSLTGMALAITRTGALVINKFGSPETIFYIPAARHSLYIFLPMMCIYILALNYTKDSIDDPGLPVKTSSPVSGKLSWNTLILGMLLTLMICGTILHIVPGITAATESHDKNVKNQYYLLNYDTASDKNLKQIHPSAEIVKKYAPQLEKLNLNIFSNQTNILLRLQNIDNRT